ncbi:hypothetical protein R0J90_24400, partial [Micrococcus sp. SIMBA_144]
LFYNPPFYPAVSSRHDPFIQETIQRVLTYSDEKHNVKLKPQHYFPGLSDLSFVGLERTKETIQPLMSNMPLYGQS